MFDECKYAVVGRFFQEDSVHYETEITYGCLWAKWNLPNAFNQGETIRRLANKEVCKDCCCFTKGAKNESRNTYYKGR